MIIVRCVGRSAGLSIFPSQVTSEHAPSLPNRKWAKMTNKLPQNFVEKESPIVPVLYFGCAFPPLPIYSLPIFFSNCTYMNKQKENSH